jgi:hypothetical protein
VNQWRLYEKLITCCLMIPHLDSLVFSTTRHVNILISQLKSRNYTYLHLCGYMINSLNVYTCLIEGRYYSKHSRNRVGVTSPGTTACWCADTEYGVLYTGKGLVLRHQVQLPAGVRIQDTEYCTQGKDWSNDLPFSV